MAEQIQKIDLSVLANNQMVRGALAIESVTIATAANSKKYLNLTLSDGVQSINAKKWDFSGDPPKAGNILVFNGSSGEFKGTLQLVVERWRLYDPEKDTEISMSDFIKTAPTPLHELWDTCQKYISLIQDTDIHNIVRHIYAQYKNEIMEAPAAISHHHAYLGGYMEHTVGVTRSAMTMADETTNLSLLLAGCLLHDIGKIFTYKRDGLAIVMTDAGQLLDHIEIGCNLVNTEGNIIGTSKQNIILLRHIIASHHGKLEWGSPVPPKLREAWLVHYADLSNVQLTKSNAIIAETAAGEKWTKFDKFNGTYMIPQDGVYPVDPYQDYMYVRGE